MELIPLLKSRNRCLERFLQASQEFLESIQSAPKSCDFPELEYFLSKRDRIITALSIHDRKLTDAVDKISSLPEKNKIVEQVKPFLEAREQMIQAIIRTDQLIFKKIEDQKLALSEQMGSARKNRQNIAKFKSAWMNEAGEGIDTKL